MYLDDSYLIMQDLTKYETLFVTALLAVLLLCFVVLAIYEIIEPEHNAYSASMAVQMGGHISEWNETHPDSQIELCDPKQGE